MVNVAMVGLTALEAVEFHLLDATVPFGGMLVWPSEDIQMCERECRWYELWQKHVDAVAENSSLAEPPVTQTPEHLCR